MRPIHLLWVLLTMTICQTAIAADSGYTTVTEIKSWSSKNDIYLGASHSCGGADIRRYHLTKDDNQQYALLVSALSTGMLVNLNYSCGTDGFPVVTGVRVSKGG